MIRDKCSTREEKCRTRIGQVCDGPRQDRCTGRVPRLPPPPPSARPAWPLFAPDLRKGVGGAGETLMTVVACPPHTWIYEERFYHTQAVQWTKERKD